MTGLVRFVVAAVLSLAAATPGPTTEAAAQMPATPAGSADQRAALDRLAFLDGEWRGTAVITNSTGSETLTQTERVGPMLGRSIRVIEGRGYAADGSTRFNALAIIGWEPRAGRYSLRSYANGYSGDHPFEATETGFRWESPAGPGAKIQYVAVVQNGEWHQVGDYVVAGQPRRRVIEMRLRRVSDSDWPAGDPVTPSP